MVRTEKTMLASLSTGTWTFVSIVGTQSMAVYNPLLAVTERFGEPAAIILLATTISRKHADDIAEHWQRQHATRPQIIDIADGVLAKDGRMPAHEAVRALQLKSCMFNVAGGMNFQVAAVAGVLPEDTLWIYPEANGVRCLLRRRHEVHESMLPLPKPVDVLALQGQQLTIDERASLPLQAALARIQRYLPAGNRAVRIGSVVFDYVWNDGNILCFLAGVAKGDGALRIGRSIIAVARRRKEFGELYDRRVFVLTPEEKIRQRLQEEGQGKIEVKRVKNMANAYNEVFQLVRRPSKPKSRKPSSRKNEAFALPGKHLAVCIGTELLPTLMAVWTHKPDVLHLLLTPGNPVIERYVEAMKKSQTLLPAKRVAWHEVSISGSETLQLPQPAGKLEVNITPGTKPQGAFLAVWAAMCGGNAYSIDTKTWQSSRLPGGDTIPVAMPTIEELLLLSGRRVKEVAENKEALLAQAEYYEKINRVLQAFVQHPEMLRSVPGASTSSADIVYEVFGSMARARLVDGTEVKWWLETGEWCENAVAWAMLMAGADDVCSRVRIDWPEKYHHATLHELQKRNPGESVADIERDLFMTDIDVVARFAGTMYVVSVKSGSLNKKPVGQLCDEVSAMASLFGRFAVPMLFFLKRTAPPKTHNGVEVFGIRELTDPEKLRNYLRDCVARRRKTA